MKSFFKNLFEYNTHSNQALIQRVLELTPPEKSHRLLSHILNAHHVWNHRMLSQPSTLEIWGVLAPEIMLATDEANHAQTEAILETFYFWEPISYTNSKGEAFRNTVQDILFHIVNHSTYHRAQIATDFREQGLEPLPTDYIFYKR
ncbi:hypothetical protein GCM10027275_40730 [Rhabdobacter roseus]|uniref:Putative damage-inducible protein DinB n=1 Tax=Rhabdobacter roseus TaxID=1655419 RepID=A0A840TWT5_9BACT|nr:DinB family protein [Rhabdobacter roseus]MBB5286047.1 putative damage-inducible protein DinB [Rhabdobacter roseus]